MGRPQFGQSGRGTSTFLPAAAYSATLSRQAQATAMPSSSFPLEPRIPAVSHHQAVALFFILKHRCRFLLGLPLSPQPALPKPLSPSSSSNARNSRGVRRGVRGDHLGPRTKARRTSGARVPSPEAGLALSGRAPVLQVDNTK